MASEAIIVGATGLVGSECLRLLLNRYDSVTALVRRQLNLTHQKLIERQIDFDRIGTIEVPSGAHIYCALGTTIKKAGSEEAFRQVDLEYPRMLATRAAAAGGARFMLVSSVGASARSKNFYLRVKGELEEAVCAMPLYAVHIFRPSFLIGERNEKRSGEALGIGIARALGFLMAGPLRKYHAIPSASVAAAMVTAANRPEQVASVDHCFVHHYDEIMRLASEG